MGVKKLFSLLDRRVREGNVCQVASRTFKEAAAITQENNNEGTNLCAVLFEPSISHQCVLLTI